MFKPVQTSLESNRHHFDFRLEARSFFFGCALIADHSSNLAIFFRVKCSICLVLRITCLCERASLSNTHIPITIRVAIIAINSKHLFFFSAHLGRIENPSINGERPNGMIVQAISLTQATR